MATRPANISRPIIRKSKSYKFDSADIGRGGLRTLRTRCVLSRWLSMSYGRGAAPGRKSLTTNNLQQQKKLRFLCWQGGNPVVTLLPWKRMRWKALWKTWVRLCSVVVVQLLVTIRCVFHAATMQTFFVMNFRVKSMASHGCVRLVKTLFLDKKVVDNRSTLCYHF